MSDGSIATNDALIAELEAIARKHLQWEGRLSLEMPLVETLALDSLRLLTLVVEVEDRFRIRLEEEDEAAIGTVGDLLGTIRRKGGDTQRPAGPRGAA